LIDKAYHQESNSGIVNIRLAGFGGQGVVMAGGILGHAAVLDGRNALQNQSYGSESRGGACRSDVIISDEQILELVPRQHDVLVAMSPPALARYLPDLKNGGILVYENSIEYDRRHGIEAFGFPAVEVAEKIFKRSVVINVIMLGCLVGLASVVTCESMRLAIAAGVPPGTEEMNCAAFDNGFQRGEAESRHKGGSTLR